MSAGAALQRALVVWMGAPSVVAARPPMPPCLSARSAGISPAARRAFPSGAGGAGGLPLLLHCRWPQEPQCGSALRSCIDGKKWNEAPHMHATIGGMWTMMAGWGMVVQGGGAGWRIVVCGGWWWCVWAIITSMFSC